MTTVDPARRAVTAEHATAQEPPPRDLRRTWRILLAVLIPLGPLGVAATRAVMPYWTDDDPATMVARTAAEPGRAEAMTWIWFVTFPALLLGALAVGYVARRGAPRLATAGALLTFTSFVMAGSFGGTDLTTHVMAREGLDQSTIVTVVEAVLGHPSVSVGTAVFVIGHIVGMILLGVAVARARVVSIWVGAIIAVSQPIHLVAAVIVPSRALDVFAGWGLTFVGFAFVALAVLRMRDDQFDLSPSVGTTRAGSYPQ